VKGLKKNKLTIKIAIVFIALTQGLQHSISPVLADIREAYPSVGVSTVQTLITVPALMCVVIALASGRLVRKIPKKRILLFGMVILGVCGIIPFLRDSFALLFFSRALLGVGLGISTALNAAVIAEHFEGRERAAVMGLQGAGIGTGMLLCSLLGGLLGSIYYKYAYFLHGIGFVSLLVIWLFLPDRPIVPDEKAKKVRLNAAVVKVSLLTAYEFFFLFIFVTNIAMHLSGNLKGDSSVAGLLTGGFSGIQIVAGLLLGRISRLLQGYTLPVAMLSFAAGCGFLVGFPDVLPMLLLGAMFCGLSQGVFAPQATFEAVNAVEPLSAAMASACIAVAMSLPQFVTPYCVNSLAKLIFGEISTSNAYTIAMICMSALPLLLIAVRRFQPTYKTK